MYAFHQNEGVAGAYRADRGATGSDDEGANRTRGGAVSPAFIQPPPSTSVGDARYQSYRFDGEEGNTASHEQGAVGSSSESGRGGPRGYGAESSATQNVASDDPQGASVAFLRPPAATSGDGTVAGEGSHETSAERREAEERETAAVGDGDAPSESTDPLDVFRFYQITITRQRVTPPPLWRRIRYDLPKTTAELQLLHSNPEVPVPMDEVLSYVQRASRLQGESRSVVVGRGALTLGGGFLSPLAAARGRARGFGRGGFTDHTADPLAPLPTGPNVPATIVVQLNELPEGMTLKEYKFNMVKYILDLMSYHHASTAVTMMRFVKLGSQLSQLVVSFGLDGKLAEQMLKSLRDVSLVAGFVVPGNTPEDEDLRGAGVGGDEDGTWRAPGNVPPAGLRGSKGPAGAASYPSREKQPRYKMNLLPESLLSMEGCAPNATFQVTDYLLSLNDGKGISSEDVSFLLSPDNQPSTDADPAASPPQKARMSISEERDDEEVVTGDGKARRGPASLRRPPSQVGRKGGAGVDLSDPEQEEQARGGEQRGTSAPPLGRGKVSEGGAAQPPANTHASISVIEGIEEGVFFAAVKRPETVYSWLWNPFCSFQVQFDLFTRYGVLLTMAPCVNDFAVKGVPNYIQKMEKEKQKLRRRLDATGAASGLTTQQQELRVDSDSDDDSDEDDDDAENPAAKAHGAGGAAARGTAPPARGGQAPGEIAAAVGSHSDGILQQTGVGTPGGMTALPGQRLAVKREVDLFVEGGLQEAGEELVEMLGTKKAAAKLSRLGGSTAVVGAKKDGPGRPAAMGSVVVKPSTALQAGGEGALPEPMGWGAGRGPAAAMGVTPRPVTVPSGPTALARGAVTEPLQQSSPGLDLFTGTFGADHHSSRYPPPAQPQLQPQPHSTTLRSKNRTDFPELVCDDGDEESVKDDEGGYRDDMSAAGRWGASGFNGRNRAGMMNAPAPAPHALGPAAPGPLPPPGATDHSYYRTLAGGSGAYGSYGNAFYGDARLYGGADPRDPRAAYGGQAYPNLYGSRATPTSGDAMSQVDGGAPGIRDDFSNAFVQHNRQQVMGVPHGSEVGSLYRGYLQPPPPSQGGSPGQSATGSVLGDGLLARPHAAHQAVGWSGDGAIGYGTGLTPHTAHPYRGPHFPYSSGAIGPLAPGDTPAALVEERQTLSMLRQMVEPSMVFAAPNAELPLEDLLEELEELMEGVAQAAATQEKRGDAPEALAGPPAAGSDPCTVPPIGYFSPRAVLAAPTPAMLRLLLFLRRYSTILISHVRRAPAKQGGPAAPAAVESNEADHEKHGGEEDAIVNAERPADADQLVALRTTLLRLMQPQLNLCPLGNSPGQEEHDSQQRIHADQAERDASMSAHVLPYLITDAPLVTLVSALQQLAPGVLATPEAVSFFLPLFFSVEAVQHFASSLATEAVGTADHPLAAHVLACPGRLIHWLYERVAFLSGLAPPTAGAATALLDQLRYDILAGATKDVIDYLCMPVSFFTPGYSLPKTKLISQLGNHMDRLLAATTELQREALKAPFRTSLYSSTDGMTVRATLFTAFGLDLAIVAGNPHMGGDSAEKDEGASAVPKDSPVLTAEQVHRALRFFWSTEGICHRTLLRLWLNADVVSGQLVAECFFRQPTEAVEDGEGQAAPFALGREHLFFVVPALSKSLSAPTVSVETVTLCGAVLALLEEKAKPTPGPRLEEEESAAGDTTHTPTVASALAERDAIVVLDAAVRALHAAMVTSVAADHVELAYSALRDTYLTFVKDTEAERVKYAAIAKRLDMKTAVEFLAVADVASKVMPGAPMQRGFIPGLPLLRPPLEAMRPGSSILPLTAVGFVPPVVPGKLLPLPQPQYYGAPQVMVAPPPQESGPWRTEWTNRFKQYPPTGEPFRRLPPGWVSTVSLPFGSYVFQNSWHAISTYTHPLEQRAFLLTPQSIVCEKKLSAAQYHELLVKEKHCASGDDAAGNPQQPTDEPPQPSPEVSDATGAAPAPVEAAGESPSAPAEEDNSGTGMTPQRVEKASESAPKSEDLPAISVKDVEEWLADQRVRVEVLDVATLAIFDVQYRTVVDPIVRVPPQGVPYVPGMYAGSTGSVLPAPTIADTGSGRPASGTSLLSPPMKVVVGSAGAATPQYPHPAGWGFQPPLGAAVPPRHTTVELPGFPRFTFSEEKSSTLQEQLYVLSETYPARGHPFPLLTRGFTCNLNPATGLYTFRGPSSPEPQSTHPVTGKEYRVTPQAFFYHRRLTAEFLTSVVNASADPKSESAEGTKSTATVDAGVQSVPDDGEVSSAPPTSAPASAPGASDPGPISTAPQAPASAKPSGPRHVTVQEVKDWLEDQRKRDEFIDFVVAQWIPITYQRVDSFDDIEAFKKLRAQQQKQHAAQQLRLQAAHQQRARLAIPEKRLRGESSEVDGARPSRRAKQADRGRHRLGHLSREDRQVSVGAEEGKRERRYGGESRVTPGDRDMDTGGEEREVYVDEESHSRRHRSRRHHTTGERGDRDDSERRRERESRRGGGESRRRGRRGEDRGSEDAPPPEKRQRL